MSRPKLSFDIPRSSDNMVLRGLTNQYPTQMGIDINDISE